MSLYQGIRTSDLNQSLWKSPGAASQILQPGKDVFMSCGGGGEKAAKEVGGTLAAQTLGGSWVPPGPGGPGSVTPLVRFCGQLFNCLVPRNSMISINLSLHMCISMRACMHVHPLTLHSATFEPVDQ